MQNITGYTPGPWRFEAHEKHSRHFGNIIGSYGKDAFGIENIRTITVQTRYGSNEENIANAELIALAPSLYEENIRLRKALEDLVNAIPNDGSWNYSAASDAARKALNNPTT